MNNSKNYDIVLEFINGNFFMVPSINEIDGDSSLLDNGVIDSTGILDIIQFIEKKFDISIKDDEVTPENLDSINRICSFIDLKIKCAE
jgi:acyl carrier protein